MAPSDFPNGTLRWFPTTVPLVCGREGGIPPSSDGVRPFQSVRLGGGGGGWAVTVRPRQRPHGGRGTARRVPRGGVDPRPPTPEGRPLAVRPRARGGGPPAPDARGTGPRAGGAVPRSTRDGAVPPLNPRRPWPRPWAQAQGPAGALHCPEGGGGGGGAPAQSAGGGRCPRRNSGLCHVCTGGNQHKAQKENGLVSGL